MSVKQNNSNQQSHQTVYQDDYNPIDQSSSSSSQPVDSIRSNRSEPIKPLADQPVDLDESCTIDQELINQLESQHHFGGSHWLPLLFALLPSLGSMFNGRPESWTNGLIILLVAFFLFKISKEDYITELRRTEWALLVFAILSPSIGVGLLIYLQKRLNLGLDYLNSSSTALFLLSSLVRPCSHLNDLLTQRARYLQDQLRFPVQLAEEINESIDQLNDQVVELQESTVTEEDLEEFKSKCFDEPLNEISKRLSKLKKSDELTHIRSVTKLTQLEEDVHRLVEKLEGSERALEKIRIDQEVLRQSPLNLISGLLLQLLNVPPQQLNDQSRGNLRPVLGGAEDVSGEPHPSRLSCLADHQANNSWEKNSQDSLNRSSNDTGRDNSKKQEKNFYKQNQGPEKRSKVGNLDDDSTRMASNRQRQQQRHLPKNPLKIFESIKSFLATIIGLIMLSMRIGQQMAWLAIGPIRILSMIFRRLTVKLVSIHDRIKADASDRYQILSEKNYRDDRSSIRGHRLRPLRSTLSSNRHGDTDDYDDGEGFFGGFRQHRRFKAGESDDEDDARRVRIRTVRVYGPEDHWNSSSTVNINGRVGSGGEYY
ncbi:hypothetical protein BY996DRAFT_6417158 [Phakopsora pachyrhizi]|nr:hypothetical protein BY996DRAFT_6417158 [Phakopsora pachyrhizi]